MIRATPQEFLVIASKTCSILEREPGKLSCDIFERLANALESGTESVSAEAHTLRATAVHPKTARDFKIIEDAHDSVWLRMSPSATISEPLAVPLAVPVRANNEEISAFVDRSIELYALRLSTDPLQAAWARTTNYEFRQVLVAAHVQKMSTLCGMLASAAVLRGDRVRESVSVSDDSSMSWTPASKQAEDQKNDIENARYLDPLALVAHAMLVEIERARPLLLCAVADGCAWEAMLALSALASAARMNLHVRQAHKSTCLCDCCTCGGLNNICTGDAGLCCAARQRATVFAAAIAGNVAVRRFKPGSEPQKCSMCGRAAGECSNFTCSMLAHLALACSFWRDPVTKVPDAFRMSTCCVKCAKGLASPASGHRCKMGIDVTRDLSEFVTDAVRDSVKICPDYIFARWLAHLALNVCAAELQHKDRIVNMPVVSGDINTARLDVVLEAVRRRLRWSNKTTVTNTEDHSLCDLYIRVCTFVERAVLSERASELETMLCSADYNELKSSLPLDEPDALTRDVPVVAEFIRKTRTEQREIAGRMLLFCFPQSVSVLSSGLRENTTRAFVKLFRAYPSSTTIQTVAGGNSRLMCAMLLGSDEQILAELTEDPPSRDPFCEWMQQAMDNIKEITPTVELAVMLARAVPSDRLVCLCAACIVGNLMCVSWRDVLARLGVASAFLRANPKSTTSISSVYNAIQRDGSCACDPGDDSFFYHSRAVTLSGSGTANVLGSLVSAIKSAVFGIGPLGSSGPDSDEEVSSPSNSYLLVESSGAGLSRAAGHDDSLACMIDTCTAALANFDAQFLADRLLESSGSWPRPRQDTSAFQAMLCVGLSAASGKALFRNDVATTQSVHASLVCASHAFCCPVEIFLPIDQNLCDNSDLEWCEYIVDAVRRRGNRRTPMTAVFADYLAALARAISTKSSMLDQLKISSTPATVTAPMTQMIVSFDGTQQELVRRAALASCLAWNCIKYVSLQGLCDIVSVSSLIVQQLPFINNDEIKYALCDAAVSPLLNINTTIVYNDKSSRVDKQLAQSVTVIIRAIAKIFKDGDEMLVADKNRVLRSRDPYLFTLARGKTIPFARTGEPSFDAPLMEASRTQIIASLAKLCARCGATSNPSEDVDEFLSCLQQQQLAYNQLAHEKSRELMTQQAAISSADRRELTIQRLDMAVWNCRRIEWSVAQCGLAFLKHMPASAKEFPQRPTYERVFMQAISPSTAVSDTFVSLLAAQERDTPTATPTIVNDVNDVVKKI